MSEQAAKAVLRDGVARRIAALPAEVRHRNDALVCARIEALEAYRDAEQVIAYLAMTDEVSLAELLGRADSTGRRVYAPVVEHGASLRFVRWTIGDTSVAGPLGRWRPSREDGVCSAPSIWLIPGRAFDRRGARLGRGRGYYDRVLAKRPVGGATVGVAYGIQIVDELPREPHDRGVDLVVTESETITVAPAGGAL